MVGSISDRTVSAACDIVGILLLRVSFGKVQLFHI